MRRTNEPLPEGFLNAISHTHVGKQVRDLTSPDLRDLRDLPVCSVFNARRAPAIQVVHSMHALEGMLMYVEPLCRVFVLFASSMGNQPA